MSADEQVTFSLAGAFTGARRAVPLAVSVFAYGIMFGVLARRAGLTLVEVLLMSGLVYAGSALAGRFTGDDTRIGAERCRADDARDSARRRASRRRAWSKECMTPQRLGAGPPTPAA